MPINSHKRTLLAAATALALGVLAPTAHAAPIYVCTSNPYSYTLYISVRFPDGAMSNFQLPPGQNDRRQGDNAGTLCWSSEPYGSQSCAPQSRWGCN